MATKAKKKTKKEVLVIEPVLEARLTLYSKGIDALLHRITPPEHIDKHPFNGLDYVRVGYVRRCIEDLCAKLNATWSYEVSDVGAIDTLLKAKQIVVRGTLTIVMPDGKLMVRENFGGSAVKCYKDTHKTQANLPMDLGNDYKSAASDALKKCASSFGIAQDVFEPAVDKTIKAKKKQEEAQADEPADAPSSDTPAGKYDYTDGTAVSMNEMSIAAKIIHKSELSDKAKVFLKDDLGGVMMSRMTKGEFQQLIDWAIKNDLKDPPF